MLGTLSLVAVGQEHHETGELAPLVLGRDEEVVDDDLGAVHEVTELRLPRHERVLGLDRVAVLETERRVLAQERVAHREESRGVQTGERHVLRAVVVVDQGGVALGERAATRVLADQANVRARASTSEPMAKRLAERPVDLALVEQRAALGELTLQLGVDREALGCAHRGVRDLEQRRAIDAGLGRRRVDRHLDEGHAAAAPAPARCAPRRARSGDAR